MTTEQLLGLLLWVGGLVFLASIGYAFWLVRRKARILETRGQGAIATVVRVDEREASSEGHTYLQQWPVIEWTDADGASRQFTWHSTNRSVGDRIDIVYDPHDPRRVQVAGVRTPPYVMGCLWLLVVAAAVALVVGGMYLVGVLA